MADFSVDVNDGITVELGITKSPDFSVAITKSQDLSVNIARGFVTPAAGANTAVQYNNNGQFAGNANAFSYNDATQTVTIQTANLNYATVSNIANLKIAGGSNGQFIQTDGNGNLVFANAATGNGGQPGLPNYSVQYNNNNSFAGSTSFVYDPNSTTVTANNANITANLRAGNVFTDNLRYANGSPYTFGNGTPAGSNQQVQFNDNGVFGADDVFYYNKDTNTLIAPNVLGQLASFGIGDFASLEVDSNANLGLVSNVHIQGGLAGQVLATDGTGNLYFTAQGNGVTTLANLTDVQLANLQDQQVLTYVSADNKWENKPAQKIFTTVNGNPLANANANVNLQSSTRTNNKVDFTNISSTNNIEAYIDANADIQTNANVIANRLVVRDGANTVAFVATNTTQSQVYDLPNAYPAANGYSLISDVNGQLSWSIAATVDTDFRANALNASGVSNANWDTSINESITRTGTFSNVSNGNAYIQNTRVVTQTASGNANIGNVFANYYYPNGSPFVAGTGRINNILVDSTPADVFAGGNINIVDGIGNNAINFSIVDGNITGAVSNTTDIRTTGSITGTQVLALDTVTNNSVGFRAANTTQTQVYDLPNAYPAANGQVFTANTDGNISWVTPYANANVANYLPTYTGNILANVITANTGNILTINSNSVVANTANISTAANLRIGGGTQGQFLQKDYSGNTIWANGTIINNELVGEGITQAQVVGAANVTVYGDETAFFTSNNLIRFDNDLSNHYIVSTVTYQGVPDTTLITFTPALQQAVLDGRAFYVEKQLPFYAIDAGANITAVVANGVLQIDAVSANANASVQRIIAGNNITISPSTGVGNVTINSNASGFNYANITTTSTAVANIVKLPAAAFRAYEMTVKGFDGVNKYSIDTITAVQPTANTIFDTHFTQLQSANVPYSALELVLVDGNANVALQVTPSSANSTTFTVEYRTF